MKSFLHVDFYSHKTIFSPSPFEMVKHLLGKNDIFLDYSIQDKYCLMGRNNLGNNFLESVCKYLSNNFVTDIGKISRPELVNCVWVISFWDQSNVSMIHFFKNFSNPNFFFMVALKSILMISQQCLQKRHVKPSGPRAFVEGVCFRVDKISFSVGILQRN